MYHYYYRLCVGDQKLYKAFDARVLRGGQDPVKRVRPADTNIAHYPYIRKIRIGGMTCANCARRVENVYNSMDGVLAEADFAEGCVTVRMKKDYKDIQLKEAVQSAGYFATGIEKL